jgi:hypothetical protein
LVLVLVLVGKEFDRHSFQQPGAVSLAVDMPVMVVRRGSRSARGSLRL